MSKRKANQKGKTFVGCLIDSELVSKFDTLCKAEGRSRSAQLRRVIASAYGSANQGTMTRGMLEMASKAD